MSPELDKKLVEKYPKIFKDRYGDIRSSCMPWGFDVGDGWFNIIDRMCGLIAWDIEYNKMPEVVATQVKEKYGLLCFYYYGGNDRTSGIVDMAERMSSITCEVCGLSGRLVDVGWLFTLCDKHAEEYAKERGVEIKYVGKEDPVI